MDRKWGVPPTRWHHGPSSTHNGLYHSPTHGGGWGGPASFLSKMASFVTLLRGEGNACLHPPTLVQDPSHLTPPYWGLVYPLPPFLGGWG